MKKTLFTILFFIIFLIGNSQSHDVTLGQNKYEMINGCKKMVSQISPANSKLNWSEWEKQYLISETQTCDFSAYIIIRKKYKNEKLSERTQFVSGCDECEEKPCGVWIYYDKSGKEKKRVDKGECNLEQFANKK